MPGHDGPLPLWDQCWPVVGTTEEQTLNVLQIVVAQAHDLAGSQR